MAFKKKTWIDRMVEFAGRRKITNVSTSAAQIIDVERAEGAVSQEGDAFSAENMNDLEKRISDAFADVPSGYKIADNDTTNNSEFLATARVAYEHGLEIDGLSRDLGGLAFGQDADGNWGYKTGGADTVIPFKGELDFDYEHNVSIPYVVAAGNPNVLHYYTMTEEDAAYSYLALFAVTAGSVVSIELSGVSGPSIVCNKPGGSYSFALIANPVLNGKVNFRHGGTGDGHVYKLRIR